MKAKQAIARRDAELRTHIQVNTIDPCTRFKKDTNKKHLDFKLMREKKDVTTFPFAGVRLTAL
ncbi:MAG: hypothetical protein WKF87_16480 [Chryseolinea sp.]